MIVKVKGTSFVATYKGLAVSHGKRASCVNV